MTIVLFLSLLTMAVGDHPEAPVSLRSGPSINPAEYTAKYWIDEAQEAIKKRSKRDPDENVARNLVMFLGDGMSLPTLTAARILKGQRAGKTGEEADLFFEGFPGVGLAKTYCVNQQVPDSSCTATAYHCGVKANYGTLGVTAAVPRRDCEASLDEANRVQSIAEWALAAGKDVGIVTTARVTHASPAGAYAKAANRNWESDGDVRKDSVDPKRCIDIAQQLVKSNPGKQFKVILGGGRQQFCPLGKRIEGFMGIRLDNQNLIKEWQQDKIDHNFSYAYVWNREQLRKQYDSPPEYLLGLFESSHMKFNLEANKNKQPSLKDMTEMAIRVLKRNKKGFFLFVESGRIDHGHHINNAYFALDETLEMDKAVEKAGEMLPENDSLIVVTADHAHVMAFNGYSARGSSVIGLSGHKDKNKMPYMTLSYTNGAGARKQVNGLRPDITKDINFGKVRWPFHAEIPLANETHGGDDVAVFARGPHFRIFAGLYEQSQIPHLMAYAACIGPGLHAYGCNTATSIRNQLLLGELHKCNAANTAHVSTLLLGLTIVIQLRFGEIRRFL